MLKDSGALKHENISHHTQACGGASLVKYKLTFSKDSHYLLASSFNVIKVFSTSSGECVHELLGHSDEIVGLHIKPQDHLQLLSCDKSGMVIKWNFQNGVLLKKYDLSNVMKGVKCFYLSPETSRWLVVVKNFQDNSKYSLYSVSSKHVENSGHVKYFHLMIVEPDQKKIAIGCLGKYYATISENQINTCSHPEKKRKWWRTGEKHLTCIATHPKEHCIAVGASDGRITLWWNFLSDKRLVSTSYHWHSFAVSDISFTAEGGHFYSGGSECVLVFWHHVAGDAKKNRRFLPRMGMPISHVTTSPNNLYVATSHVDNAIHLVNSNNCIEQVYQGLTQGHQWMENTRSVGFDSPVPTGLSFDPKSKALVLNGKPGHLQFYSVAEDKQLFNLDIVGENYIYQEDSLPVINTEIIKAAFDVFGDWLATVEYRSDGNFSEELRLKFWSFDSISQRFSLNTAIDHPHNSIVTELKFRPTSRLNDDTCMAVTISRDVKFKMWSVVENSSFLGDKNCWTCTSVGYFHSVPPNCSSFSEDGSLLAVGFGCIAVLWQPEGNIIKEKLAHPRLQHDISQIEFGRKQCSHLVAVGTMSSLTVWNVLSLSISWTINLNVTHLISDPFSDVMCTFTKERKLFVFRPSEIYPFYSKESCMNKDILHCAFIPHQYSEKVDEGFQWEKHSRLIVMDIDQQLFTISKTDIKGQKALQMKKSIPNTPFGSLIAEKSKSHVKRHESMLHTVTGSTGKKAILEMIRTPANVLPPASSLCSDFINLLLNPKISRLSTDVDESNVKKMEI